MRTKIEAVKLSLACWKWLAETGRGKIDWPLYSKIAYDDGHCPCCTVWSGNDKCRGCPLRSKTLCWRGSGEAYDNWDLDIDKKHNAAIIRDALAAWLKKCGAKKSRKEN
jgi:hypothetical protein